MWSNITLRAIQFTKFLSRWKTFVYMTSSSSLNYDPLWCFFGFLFQIFRKEKTVWRKSNAMIFFSKIKRISLEESNYRTMKWATVGSWKFTSTSLMEALWIDMESVLISKKKLLYSIIKKIYCSTFPESSKNGNFLYLYVFI